MSGEPVPQGDALSPARLLVFMLWGPMIWGLQFTASYAGHAVLCAQGVPPMASRLLVVAAILAIITIAPMVLQARRIARRMGLTAAGGGDALILVARTIAGLSVIAALWTACGALLLQSCITGR